MESQAWSVLSNSNPQLDKNKNKNKNKNKRIINKRMKSMCLQSRSSKMQMEENSITTSTSSSSRWKSEKQHQIYSSKLLQALNLVRSSNAQPQQQRRRSVREAADTALAVAAKGRTLWSRSILTNRRLKLKFNKQFTKRSLKKKSTGSSSSRSMRKTTTNNNNNRFSVLRLKRKNLPAFQRKVRVLGRLVPGCRKQPMPVVLEEATDYIAALEMQVRAMSRLADLLSRSSTTSTSTVAE
ncbi:hypothetical protein ACFE04_012748 [Oxalis oulophora]